MNVYAIISLIAFITSLILAITFVALAPRRMVGRIFFSGTLFLLVLEFSLFMIFLQKDAAKVTFWAKLATASLCFLPPTWALISLVYGRSDYRELLKRRIWYLSLVYVISLVFFILFWKNQFFSLPRSFSGDIFLISSFGRYFLIFALLNTVSILINLENTLRFSRISSRKAKRAPLYVLIGSFLFWIYAISQMLMYSRISNHLAVLGFLIIILTNVMMFFYSIRYGLSQLEVSLGREVFYSSAFIFIVGLYLLVIGMVGKIVQLAGGSINLYFSVIAAFIVLCLLIATLVSKSLKERIKIFIDRNFYKNRYNYREQWCQFSESLSTVVNMNDLLSTIRDYMVRTFSLHQAAILLLDEFKGSFGIATAKNFMSDHSAMIQANSEFIDWLFRHGEAINVQVLFEQFAFNENEAGIFKGLNAVVCVPMITQRKFVGILIVGEKENAENYSKEDFELLETLANQSSVAILNAKLTEDLMVSRELASYHKLSSFVLHDLRNSVSMLSMATQNARVHWDNQDFQKDMLMTITNTIEKMKQLVSKISSVSSKLSLNLQMLKINELIERVLDSKFTETSEIKIEKIFEDIPMVTVDSEIIERVIENLLINAIEALPKGGEIRIATKLIHQPSNSIHTKKELAEIEIADNGFGMSEDFIQNRLFKPFQTTKKKGLGIGLYQCREMIRAHGGTIEVKSKVNEGTQFKILLPVANGYYDLQNIRKEGCKNTISLN